MEVLVAQQHGFCDGVRRALAILDRAMDDGQGPIACVGSLIHNQAVMDGYLARGLRVIDSLGELRGERLLVRAHGLAESELAAARAMGASILDASCPYVRQVAALVGAEARAGRLVCFVGERLHPEVQAATRDHAQSVRYLEPADFDPRTYEYPQGKLSLLCQTTLAREDFARVAEAFRAHCPDLRVHEGICHSTRLRQESALSLARRVDAMIILGSDQSSNTKRLVEVCAPIVPSYRLARITELDPSLLAGKSRVGLSSGASTPEYLMEEALAYLRRL